MKESLEVSLVSFSDSRVSTVNTNDSNIVKIYNELKENYEKKQRNSLYVSLIFKKLLSVLDVSEDLLGVPLTATIPVRSADNGMQFVFLFEKETKGNLSSEESESLYIY